jgi:hypothetical protein
MTYKFSGFQTYVGRAYKAVVMMYWGMKAQLHAFLISVFQLRQAVMSVFWIEGWRGGKMYVILLSTSKW